MTAPQIGALQASAARAADAAQAVDAIPPAFRRPAPRAVAHLPEASREAARRIACWAEIAASGGVGGVDLLNGGGGGAGQREGPQARVAWAIGRLRAAVAAIGAGRVRLDANGGSIGAVMLVARVCVHDQPPSTILRDLGLKRSRGRALALLRGLNAALDRVAVVEGLATPAPKGRK